MSYMIDCKENNNKLKIIPLNTTEEILQNLFVLLNTVKGTVPMYRNFGINLDVVDENINLAKAHITNTIYDAVNKYEPRAKIVNITFKGDAMLGKLYPIVEVEINEQGY